MSGDGILYSEVASAKTILSVYSSNRSSGLYDYNLAQFGPSMYYNTSPGSGELSINAAPWGFFSQVSPSVHIPFLYDFD